MKYYLKPHPATSPKLVKSVEVEVTATDLCEMMLDFRVDGDKVVLPDWKSSCRENGLWNSTCFELFLGTLDSESYFEFNFSPSSRWAAYKFDEYRKGMSDHHMTVEPHLEFDPDRPLELSVDLDLADMPRAPLFGNLTAVIEEHGGHKSYWALAHPEGPPDFHDRDCFVAHLPPLERP